ncbi:MAG TPA: 5'-methylthioadenosine/adenosylhomocysteine nucleosidase [Bacilli bacterium]|nr:MAG: 5'-methylthioadenosine/S-adenosylhomocysteine nucleosidase [Tenericutes bacterium ADurb.BinA124]HPX85007.1 5'-methylthioadenosine/adenosylhomocysteine nucleosidase [Bacilli bacterium]HQC75075.1 5'-methylthioadenosine/adenosylhomocysteine nucleosidase [Bacilli bacterium]
MLIAIIAAMSEETDFLVSQLSAPKPISWCHYQFYQGTIGRHKVVVVQGGVGKTASGMLLSALMANFPNVDKIINIGVAGGVLGKTKVGDLVVSEKMAYGDVDIRGGGKYLYGQMSGCPRFFTGDSALLEQIKALKSIKALFGGIISTDRFVTNHKETSNLINRYFSDLNVLCFDMESAAFAQGCFVFKKPFLSVRAISDVVGENLQGEFTNNLNQACLISNQFLIQLLSQI